MLTRTVRAAWSFGSRPGFLAILSVRPVSREIQNFIDKGEVTVRGTAGIAYRGDKLYVSCSRHVDRTDVLIADGTAQRYPHNAQIISCKELKASPSYA